MNPLSWFKKAWSFDQAWREPFNRAMAASSKGEWDQAIAEYSEAIRHHPILAESFYNRAIVYSNKRDWEAARTDCTEVIRLEAKHYKAYYWRGVANRVLEQRDGALADFDQALKLHPRYAQAFYQRGLTYQSMGKIEKAETDLSQAIALGWDAYVERAMLHAQAKEWAKVRADMTEAIRSKPADPQYYRYRAWFAGQQTDWDAAVADVSEAIRLEPARPDHYSARGFYHHARGDYAKAIQDDRQAIALDERCAHAHSGLAWILATCPEENYRDGGEALRHALIAVGLDDGTDKAYRLSCTGTLAAAYAETGNFTEAIPWAKRFLELGPPEENIGPGRLRLGLYEQGKPFREKKGAFECIGPC